MVTGLSPAKGQELAASTRQELSAALAGQVNLHPLPPSWGTATPQGCLSAAPSAGNSAAGETPSLDLQCTRIWVNRSYAAKKKNTSSRKNCLGHSSRPPGRRQSRSQSSTGARCHPRSTSPSGRVLTVPSPARDHLHEEAKGPLDAPDPQPAPCSGPGPAHALPSVTGLGCLGLHAEEHESRALQQQELARACFRITEWFGWKRL